MKKSNILVMMILLVLGLTAVSAFVNPEGLDHFERVSSLGHPEYQEIEEPEPPPEEEPPRGGGGGVHPYNRRGVQPDVAKCYMEVFSEIKPELTNVVVYKNKTGFNGMMDVVLVEDNRMCSEKVMRVMEMLLRSF